MPRRHFRVLVVPLLVVLSALPAAAQFTPNLVDASASCSGGTVTASVRVTAGAGIDADWQGWVLARSTVGTCSEWVTVSPVQALPDSGLSVTVEVTDLVEEDRAYRYGVRIVTADGAIIDPPADVFFWPEISVAYVTCGVAPLVRGRLQDLGFAVFVERCPGACWAPVAILDWDQVEPYENLVGTDLVFEIFGGEVVCGGIEGCGLDVVTDINNRVLCDDPVAVQRRDWSAVKSIFR
jgi:hypothetical protein